MIGHLIITQGMRVTLVNLMSIIIITICSNSPSTSLQSLKPESPGVSAVKEQVSPSCRIPVIEWWEGLDCSDVIILIRSTSH